MSNENMVDWRCRNYGICKKADEKQAISLGPGVPFRCPECGEEEGVQLKAKAPIPIKPILFGLGAVVLLALVAWLIIGPRPDKVIIEPRIEDKPIENYPIVAGAMIDDRTGLAKQILVRPQSTLRTEANVSAPPTEGAGGGKMKLKDFQRLFVFETKDHWLKVGESTASAVGWLHEDDTVDWRHSLVVEFTSPDNRRPVLFFKDREPLLEICDNPEAHQPEIEGYYKQIQELAANPGALINQDQFPVLCIEPKDKISDFYMIPVLEGKIVEMGDRSARILKLTAASSARGATTLQDGNYLTKAVPTAPVGSSKVPLDIVFVMDMTGSMQPWLDGVLKVMLGMAEQLKDEGSDGDLVRLGFWGYQDDPGISGIKFRTKNYTSELVRPQDFASSISSLKVNELTQDSYPEDVFSGIADAISSTKWRSSKGKTTKVLVLIGDAPGHSTKEEGGATGMDAPQVRQRASDANVKIVSVQIKDTSNPAYAKYHALTGEQFRELAKNDNRPPAFISLESQESTAFEDDLRQIIKELTIQKSIVTPGGSGQKGRGTKIAEGLLAAARVDQVSAVKNEQGEVIAPRDFTGWVVDLDLTSPDIRALEPKLVVSKNELSTLQQTVSETILNARKATIIGTSFFELMRDAVGKTASGQEKTLAGFLPKFLSGLPYKSDLMDKPASWWDSQTTGQQEEFMRGLEAKLAYYRELNEDPSKWKPLNKDDEPGLHVTALPLSQLP